MKSKPTMHGEYDQDYLGSTNSQNPDNFEQTDQSEIEMLTEELAYRNRSLKFCKDLIKQMQEIEKDGKFQIVSTDQKLSDTYCSLKERLFYQVKYKI